MRPSHPLLTEEDENDTCETNNLKDVIEMLSIPLDVDTNKPMEKHSLELIRSWLEYDNEDSELSDDDIIAKILLID